MSTNTPEDSFIEVPPDPESEILPEIVNTEDLPSLVPVYEDLASEDTARQLPEMFDEFGVPGPLQSIQEDPPTPIGRTWLWDFTESRFHMNGTTARKSPDDEFITIEQWIRRCLTTERYAHAIYPEWFGITLAPVHSGEYAGRVAADYLADEIRDALIQHDRISEVEDISVSEDNGTLWATFTVLLDRGNTITVAQRLLDLS